MIELNQLIDSKIYVKNSVSFMPVRSILDPWLNAINYNGTPLRIAVQNEVVNENDNGEANIAYPRFLVETSYSDNPQNRSEYGVQGIIVAMDTAPIVKLYAGVNAKACTNLSIWNAEYTYQQGLLTDLKSAWKVAKKFYDSMDLQYIESNNAHSTLSLEVDNNQVNRLLGNMLRLSQFNKLGVSPIVQAAKRLSDKSSAYYFNPNEGTRLENVYQAITQSITDSREFLSKPERTLLAYEMIRNN